MEAAQAEVSAAQDALAAAQSQASSAAAAFCTSASEYIEALDRYGDVVNATAPTVGDVMDAGQDLAAPRDETQAAAEDAVDAQEAVAAAEQDLAAAQANLAAVEASASGGTPAPAGSSPAPSVAASPAPASVARVEQAESELADAQAGITARTPLVQAAEQFNAAAVAVEMAWLQLLADAGCLSGEQQTLAVNAVREYTVALQQSLAETGYYTAPVDGVYGPMTVDAVEALQAAHSLPQTGTVDKATEAALQAELDALGDAATLESTATTAALQQTLRLAGYWDGPVDGVWSDALTQAVMTLQTDLGVPVTGTVDAATISAFQQAVAAVGATATPSPSPETSSSPPAPASPTGT